MSNIYSNESSREEIITMMKELKFAGMLESYDEVIADTIRRNATFNYGLDQLLKSELRARTEVVPLGLWTNKCVNSVIGYIKNNIIYEG